MPDEAAAKTERPKREPVTLKRRIAGLTAAVSVGGLVLAAVLPLVQATSSAANESESVAAAQPDQSADQQRLFSEVSAEDLPDSLTDVTTVKTEDSVKASYDFREGALVSYPFRVQVTLTDGFGYRTAPVAQFHDAQDMAAAAGTQIQAIADGRVIEAGFASDGCGFALKLEHLIDGKEVTSRYCHMQDASHDYKVGDEVQMGDPAGKVGNTGMSFGAHLHLALVVDGEPTDPMPFLSKYSKIDREKGESTIPEFDQARIDDAIATSSNGGSAPAPPTSTPTPVPTPLPAQ